MKHKTVNKYIKILKEIKSSGKNITGYCKGNKQLYNAITTAIYNAKKNTTVENVKELIDLYDSVRKHKAYEVDYIRDNDGKIKEYRVTVNVQDSIPFTTILSRSDAETIFGLYTYYGSNITARNVTNEFPKYTLAEIKKIFRAFRLYKDSIWAPPHLIEEYTVEELANYRMQLKERAAFKYADYRQERDFKNVINKLADKINKLEDTRSFVKNLIDNKIDFEKSEIITNHSEFHTTGIICLSDLHIGAFNQPEGYLDLPAYTENEINRRLDYIVNVINLKNWDKIIILNLGDNIDSYRKMTTSMTHELPCVYTDREIGNMYLRIMMRFFNSIKNRNVEYISIGSGNHSGSVGYLLDVALAYQLKSEFKINGYVSDKEINSFDVNGISFIYLHGRSEAIKGQKKPFPLNLDMKTQCWFNDFFSETDLQLNKRKVILKGDLHQYSINSVASFDYINCPSIYGSSTYIVSNYGNTPWGCVYIEIDQQGNYTTGLIRE